MFFIKEKKRMRRKYVIEFDCMDNPPMNNSVVHNYQNRKTTARKKQVFAIFFFRIFSFVNYKFNCLEIVIDHQVIFKFVSLYYYVIILLIRCLKYISFLHLFVSFSFFYCFCFLLIASIFCFLLVLLLFFVYFLIILFWF